MLKMSMEIIIHHSALQPEHRKFNICIFSSTFLHGLISLAWRRYVIYKNLNQATRPDQDGKDVIYAFMIHPLLEYWINCANIYFLPFITSNIYEWCVI